MFHKNSSLLPCVYMTCGFVDGMEYILKSIKWAGNTIELVYSIAYNLHI